MKSALAPVCLNRGIRIITVRALSSVNLPRERTTPLWAQRLSASEAEWAQMERKLANKGGDHVQEGLSSRENGSRTDRRGAPAWLSP